MWLRKLRAANAGDKGEMQKLILTGFARKGARRRQLLGTYVNPQGPDDSSALEALLDAAATKSEPEPKVSETGSSEEGGHTALDPHRVTKTAFYEKWDMLKMKQLFKSQRTAQDRNSDIWSGRPIKTLNENHFVPDQTIWGKKPGEQLVKTKRASFWRMNMAKVMVPLSKGEWDLLARLSEGAQESEDWKVPERRAPAKGPKGGERKNLAVWDWKEYASKPTALAEQPKTRQAILRTGQKVQGPYNSQRVVNEIKPRWFRRTYGRTWQTTPVQEEKQALQKHEFSWGEQKSRVVAPSAAQLEIFQGVNRKGQKVEEKSPSS